MGSFLAVAIATAAVLAFAVSASADPPVKDRWFASFSFTDDWTCPGTATFQSNEERDNVGGLHQQFTGDVAALCDYLAGP